jgi:hypothetical protein
MKQNSLVASLAIIAGCAITILLMELGAKNPWALIIGFVVSLALYFKEATARNTHMIIPAVLVGLLVGGLACFTGWPQPIPALIGGVVAFWVGVEQIG